LESGEFRVIPNTGLPLNEWNGSHFLSQDFWAMAEYEGNRNAENEHGTGWIGRLLSRPQMNINDFKRTAIAMSNLTPLILQGRKLSGISWPGLEGAQNMKSQLDSWMSDMKGKRVLIVHPFIKTIEKQIHHLHKIFPDQSWFEECTFTFIKPPMTLAGNHEGKDWQEHYNTFLEILSTQSDFDIALVAAGGYGMLLSDFIFTELKKSVMYIGGALQLFFGIIGKRWVDNKEIMAMMNDAWVHPCIEETPLNYIQVEKGCYW
jgi:hypothetical protein